MTNHKKQEVPSVRIVDIPEIFFRSETNKPFQCCTMCRIDFMESNIPYVIEKAIKNYPADNRKDVIFEFAMCIQCVQKTRENLSKESLQRIEDYLRIKARFQDRKKLIRQPEKYQNEDWISHCIINNSESKHLPEYQIIGQCQGTKMIFGEMPYMLSCDATEEMQELLSPQTRDELNRFYDENLGLPPDLRELFKTKTPVF